MEDKEDPCKYSPERGVDYYAAGLAGLLRVIVGSGQRSTHAYVKDVRKALETLVFTVWDKYEEYLDVIAESNIPDSLRSPKARECFRDLLVGLLRRFRETADSVPIGARIRLMNMVISAIAEMARYNLPPTGVMIKNYVFSRKDESEGGGGK
ncbi:MAG: hypothetical protein F7C35_00170 [Desulfurococcales archaeon]|nr:hypothetical protein [Desulfurococcales archaeon]